MFIGHTAVGLAAKPFAPRVSLGWLIAAAWSPDLLCGLLIALGLEHPGAPSDAGPFLKFGPGDYAWSHSLAVTALLAALAAAFWFVRTRDRRGALVLAGAVLSHWLLDLVTHLPDMPLVPGGRLHGWGLWSSFWGCLIVEGGLFLAGAGLYLRTRRARAYPLAYLSVWAALYATYLILPAPQGGTAVLVLGGAALFAAGTWIDGSPAHKIDSTRNFR